jgi:hypothetical protein
MGIVSELIANGFYYIKSIGFLCFQATFTKSSQVIRRLSISFVYDWEIKYWVEEILIMKITANESMIDRFVRGILGAVLLAYGVFWVGGTVQIITVILGVILAATGLIGFCPLYKVFKINSNPESSKPSGLGLKILPVVVILTLVLASVASVYVTRKQYLENYNTMNADYKQALFQTGQKNRAESVKYYSQLQTSYANFSSLYQGYRPYALWGDQKFSADLTSVQGIITSAQENVQSGDLAKAHTQLEQVRPVFQDVFKRNGFSMLAINLVDFHDVMEKLITASGNKDAAEVTRVYAEADTLLKNVEAEVNDGDIQAIRGNLDGLLKLAQDGSVDDLAKKADDLKKSFVKVYLIRG